MPGKIIHILRRDFRYEDNLTFVKIKELFKDDNFEILPIFIFTPEQADKKNNTFFNQNCFNVLCNALLQLNPVPLIFKNDLIKSLVDLKKEYDYSYISFANDYTPFSEKRDDKIKKWAADNNINVITSDDILLIQGSVLTKTTKTVYKKFTPFYNEALKYPVLKPQKYDYKKMLVTSFILNKLKLFFKSQSTINKIFFVKNNLWSRDNALIIIKKKYNNYGNDGLHNSTGLSPFIKFGLVSIREAYKYFKPNEKLKRQLYWREFYYKLGWIEPEYKIKDYDINDYKKWKNGNTGVKYIDDAMKFLNKTGYIHNRLRMIVGSYLVKQLNVDWKKGEKYFAKKLLDYDPIQNRGGWLWVSSLVVESQPYYRKFNPVLQEKRHGEIDDKYYSEYRDL